MAKDKFDKAFEDMKSGKIQGPTNDDMGPLPVKKADSKKKEDKVLPDQLMNNPVRFKKPSERTAEENAMMSNYKKGGKVKCMASRGKVSQLAKANGIAVKGKSRGRII